MLRYNSKEKEKKRTILLNPIFMIVFVMFITLHAQNVFQKIYDTPGSEYGYNLYRTLDNGYIIGGVYSFMESEMYNPFLLKLNSDYSVEWFKVFGDISCDYVSYTQVCDDGSYVLAGNCYNPNYSAYDVFLIKVDNSGGLLSSKIFPEAGDQVVRAFRKSVDGGFLLGGRWSEDAFLMKVDQEFNLEWWNILGGSAAEVIYACQAVSDSEIVAAGYTMSYGMGDADIILLKMNLNGQIKWAETIGSGFKEVITSDNGLFSTVDGGFILTGYITGFGAGGNDILVVKVDEAGKLQWSKTYGGSADEIGFMGKETADSGYVIAGYGYSFSQQFSDGYLIKIGENGSMEWSKAYGGTNEDRLFFIYQDTLNAILFCGRTASFNVQQTAVYLVKTDPGDTSSCNGKAVETTVMDPELIVSPITELMIYSIFEMPVTVIPIEIGTYAVCDAIEDTTITIKNADTFPKSFDLNQNYPNPFNPVTTIEYSIAKNSSVALRIYNVEGKQVRTLMANKPALVGNYKIQWDGKDDKGSTVASGAYFYQIETEGFVKARKMIVIK